MLFIIICWRVIWTRVRLYLREIKISVKISSLLIFFYYLELQWLLKLLNKWNMSFLDEPNVLVIAPLPCQGKNFFVLGWIKFKIQVNSGQVRDSNTGSGRLKATGFASLSKTCIQNYFLPILIAEKCSYRSGYHSFSTNNA